MFFDEKKRLPITAKVKNEVYARSGGYCENPRCKIKDNKMKKNDGNFHHTRAPHINPTAKTVQFLCPNCHQWHGHSHSTKTSESFLGVEKEVKIKRNMVGGKKPNSVAKKPATKKKQAKNSVTKNATPKKKSAPKTRVLKPKSVAKKKPATKKKTTRSK